MSPLELSQLANLLEKFARREVLTESERHAAMRLVAAVDQAAERHRGK
jgi:hypothetical protein